MIFALNTAGKAAGKKEDLLKLGALACQFACPANGFSLFADALFRWLLIRAAHLHFPEDTFTLHFFLQRPKRLIDIVLTNEYLNHG